MPEPEFPTFELIPADTTELALDDELANLVDPLDIPEAELDDFEIGPLGRTWFWDLDDPTAHGQSVPVSGIQSVAMIAQVALHVPRGQYVIFPPDFGMEDPEALIGYPNDTERRASYIADIRETLMACHERISSVENIEFLYGDDEEVAYLNLTLEIDGEVDLRLEGLPLLV